MARLLQPPTEWVVGMKWFRILGSLLALTVYQRAQAQTATVTWGTGYQTIQGFGASNHAAGTHMNSYDNFFFQTLGYSLLRIGVPEDGSCTSIGSACATGGDSVTDMQACMANGCQVWATSWTPPAIYKTNGNIACTAGSGSGGLIVADEAAYATYLSNFIASLKTYYSLPLYSISVQNEPSQCVNYDSSLMSASQFDSFIKTNLGPTMQAAGQWPGTLIMMPESPGWYNYGTYANICMNDAACANYIGINAFHGYDNSFSITNPDVSGARQFWETEVSNGSGFGPVASGCTAGTWCPGIADAMMWAGIIDYNVGVVGENSWNYWNYVYPASDNEGLVNPGQRTPIATRAYVIANWAKFVRPGWVRIDATHAPQTQVSVTAFKNPAGTAFAVVAVNQNSEPVNVEFSLVGFPSVTSVTPTVTSASSNLEDQANVNISNDAFSYSLPGTSVTTFHGTAALSSASKSPASPTNLAATVH